MKTNSLIYKCNKIAPNGEQWEISIRLNDDCKNGHQDFSITGTSYEKGKAKTEKNMIHGGACGDEIATLWPEFEIFNRLHLCDCKGRPMYAAENGRYHFNNTAFEVGRDYLRLTAEEAKELIPYCSEALGFAFQLHKMKIIERWESEANEAIKLLEILTGNEFVNDSKRYQYETITPEQEKEFLALEKAGHFTTASVAQRKIDKINEANKKRFDDEMAQIEKTKKSAAAKEKALKAILSAGLPLQNCIFYDHSSSCNFNWKSYDILITEEQFTVFVKNNKIDGFTFELETKK
jgi:hypothetical protein